MTLFIFLKKYIQVYTLAYIYAFVAYYSYKTNKGNENLEKWRKDHNISLSSIGRLINVSKSRMSNLEKGHRSVNKEEMEKLKILDRHAAEFDYKPHPKITPVVIAHPKLKFKLIKDKNRLRKTMNDLKKVYEKISMLDTYLRAYHGQLARARVCI